jgi:hypothetical protein
MAVHDVSGVNALCILVANGAEAFRHGYGRFVFSINVADQR